MEEKDMSDKKKNPYTTIHMHRTTKDRLMKLKGRGLSWDRFLNERFPQEKERNESEKNEPQT